jgi:hypothetical protein
MATAKARSTGLTAAPPATLRAFLRTIVSRITVHDKELRIVVIKPALRAALLGTEASATAPTDRYQSRDEDSVFSLTVEAQLRRSSGAVRLIVPKTSSDESPARLNVPLLRAVVHARCWYEKLLSGGLESQPAFAKEMGISARYIRKISRCAFLAPDIVELILQGRQPAELTLEKLLENLPLEWIEQRKVFGLSKS